MEPIALVVGKFVFMLQTPMALTDAWPIVSAAKEWNKKFIAAVQNTQQY